MPNFDIVPEFWPSKINADGTHSQRILTAAGDNTLPIIFGIDVSGSMGRAAYNNSIRKFKENLMTDISLADLIDLQKYLQKGSLSQDMVNAGLSLTARAFVIKTLDDKINKINKIIAQFVDNDKE